MRHLLERYPVLAAALPTLGLTELPTPLARADTLAKSLGIPELLIKRDDLSARPYGGNKVRKLDVLLADAVDRGCDTVVTFGAAGSNHALATAIYAIGQGLECHAVVTDQPQTNYVATTLRYHARLGTKLSHASGYADSIRQADEIADRHSGGPERVCRIAWGGSSWQGAAAFADAALELAAQTGDAIPERLYVACGTMGTSVGLALGLRLAGLPTTVVAVQVVPRPVTSTESFAKLFDETNRELRAADASVPILDDAFANVELRTEFLGPGYAETTPECREAVELIDATEGLRLETTYTGKALAAMIADARAGKISGPIAFWQTYNSHPAPDALDRITAEALPAALRPYLGEESGE